MVVNWNIFLSVVIDFYQLPPKIYKHEYTSHYTELISNTKISTYSKIKGSHAALS